jgi:hypothetical protein
LSLSGALGSKAVRVYSESRILDMAKLEGAVVLFCPKTSFL